MDLNFPGRYMQGSPLLAWSVSVLVALVLSALVGMLLERVFVRPMVGEELFSLAIITLGMHIVLLTVVTDLIGPDPRSMADPWGDARVDLGFVIIPQTEIAQFVVAIALMALVGVFFRTRTGGSDARHGLRSGGGPRPGDKRGKDLRHSLGDRGCAGHRRGGVRIRVPAPGRGLSRHGPAGDASFPGHHPRRARLRRGSGDRRVAGGAGRGARRPSYLTHPIFGTGFSGIVPYLLMMVVLFVRPYGIFGTGEVRRV